VKLPPRRSGSAPLAIAAFIAIPLFFTSLMSSTLALEKPRVVQWTKPTGGALQTTWHDPSAATEARIWLWALFPVAVLVLIGLIATYLPFGFYVPCAAAIVIAMGVVHKTATWEAHHTARFPWGVDLIPATNAASDTRAPGEWEKLARETALSLQHWTIGLAIVCIVAMASLAVRRKYFQRRKLPGFAPIESVHAGDVTMPPMD
jgi:hypothetical protein